jgi:hypothetical protein
MKYTINGFNQDKLIKYGLDNNDALILRWFIDFKDSGKMKTFIIEDKLYYWLLYDYLIKDLPILKIKKDMLYRRLKKMVAAEILKNRTKRSGGTYSLYRLGNNYIHLIKDLSENIPITLGKYSDESRNKFRNKDHSTIDHSTKYKTDSKNIKYIPLARLLYTEHLKHDEKFLYKKNEKELVKTFLNWADDIRKLIEIDGRSYSQVEQVIKWCQHDGCFWIPNILSGNKLRLQFPKLFLQYKNDKDYIIKESKPERSEMPEYEQEFQKNRGKKCS